MGKFCYWDKHPRALCHMRVAAQPRALPWGVIWRAEECGQPGKQKVKILAGAELREFSWESREEELGGMRAAGAAQAGPALTPALPNPGSGCQGGLLSLSIINEFLQPLQGLAETKWNFM